MTAPLAGAARDALFDRLDALPAGVHRVRQSAPGVYTYVDGSSVRVELPEVGQRVKHCDAKPEIELKTPLSSPKRWVFRTDGKATQASVNHRTWFGARAQAAVILKVEPGALRLVRSPL